MGTLLDDLKCIVKQVDDGCGSPCGPRCPPCGPPVGCPPCPYPYLQVCMLSPPCCTVPTQPEYVKPLQLPRPPSCNQGRRSDPETQYRNRTANFYNYYNRDYHNTGERSMQLRQSLPWCAVTVDGKKPPQGCEDYTKRKIYAREGCPTGFKPCQMKLCPPPFNHPLATWEATVMPCPPKYKRVSSKYIPGKCTRPCCKHWKPKGGVCLYNRPCKAHCYDDHPFGIKPFCA